MHEISLCEHVLQIIEQQSREQQFSKVNVVWLEIGVLAGIDIDSLHFAFDVVMSGTLADKARMEIITVTAQAWCSRCNRNVEILQRFDLCPVCGSQLLQVNCGDHMRITELEVQ